MNICPGLEMIICILIFIDVLKSRVMVWLGAHVNSFMLSGVRETLCNVGRKLF